MWIKTLALLAAALALGGCASLNNVDVEVSSYSQWPAGARPASYAFERLPSQQARLEQQVMLEDAARPALAAAGFTPAADDAAAQFKVQLGVRVTGIERSPFDDPFFWPGGFNHPRFYGRRGVYWPGWYSRFDPYPSSADYEREVALVIRDRQSGQALYEAHANNDGLSPSLDSVLPALFAAAMKDFPNGGVNPRRVTIVPAATAAPASTIAPAKP